MHTGEQLSSLDQPTDGLNVVERDGVVVATLDRPPANPLNRALVTAITRLLGRCGDQGDPPILLTGSGKRIFCAGGDLKEVDDAGAGSIDGRMQGFHDLLVGMDRYAGPTLAAVNGDCVGGGLELALFADVVLAVPHARFGFPEIRHGLLPADKGIARLVRLVGFRSARELLLGGNLIDADQAKRIGLVDAIVDPDALYAAAHERAKEAGRRPPVLYAALKQSLNGSDKVKDQRLAEATLAKAAVWISDPIARGLRDGWRGEAPSSLPPAARTRSTSRHNPLER